MHELAVTENILKTVLRHAEADRAQRVVSVNLRIGELTDLVDEWVQRYFDYLSRGTIAQGAAIRIERTPVTFRCETCGKLFPVKVREPGGNVCPDCGGGKSVLVSGREFFIKNIEVI
jgi:hydrogenase nickel incorporation protein HypA/HybF